MYATIYFWRIDADEHFHKIDFGANEEIVNYLRGHGYEVNGEPKKKEITVLTMDDEGPVTMKIKIH